MPDVAGSEIAAVMSRISFARPTNGHVNRMRLSLKDQVTHSRPNERPDTDPASSPDPGSGESK
jgi:hypothetical protein